MTYAKTIDISEVQTMYIAQYFKRLQIILPKIRTIMSTQKERAVATGCSEKTIQRFENYKIMNDKLLYMYEEIYYLCK